MSKALRLRCPNCGEGPIFANWLNKTLPQCPRCGLSYQRESGYYMGGMILTYIVVAFILVALYVITLLLPDIELLSRHATAVWAPLAIALTFAAVRPCYSIWLSLDYWFKPWPAGKYGR